MDIAGLIDHTLLRPDATRADILKICQEALEHGFASVCVNSFWVPLVSAQLRGSRVKVCSVIAFPFGASLTRAKVAEAEAAMEAGAQEIDMVQNIGALLSADDNAVESDVAAVTSAAHRSGAIVKVILETGFLSDEQKIKSCILAKAAGADFVKTSTGFGPSGATEHDIVLMRRTVGPELGVKASGGIRDLETAQKMVAAGATRIGASASVKIVSAVPALQEGQSGY